MSFTSEGGSDGWVGQRKNHARICELFRAQNAAEYPVPFEQMSEAEVMNRVRFALLQHKFRRDSRRQPRKHAPMFSMMA